MKAPSAPREIALCAAWHAGSIGPTLSSTDGEHVEIVHRGAWSHGLGPDFRDALILFNGRELRSGGVEVHLSSRGWIDHGHHLDPAYDRVVLHVVGHHDGTIARRLDGGVVPVVEFGPLDQIEIPDFASWEWDRVGGQVCAARIAASHPTALRNVLSRLGDVRIAARAAKVESRLPTEPPGEVLWEELLDGLGFAANREPMRALARAVGINALESHIEATPAVHQLATARGILLGAAGFLPLSPTEAHLGRLTPEDVIQLEVAWQRRGGAWRSAHIPSSSWNRARIRPANHPVARLTATASIVVATNRLGGLLAAFLDLIQDDRDLIDGVRQFSENENRFQIGADRALDILASGILPVALGIACYSDNQSLLDAATHRWEQLPAPAPNAVTRRAALQVAGPTPLGRIGARGSQGLIHLDTVLCQPRRCFECPVAAAELSVKG